MIFSGVGRVFSTENDGQYDAIGAFWDEMEAKYGLERLRGLGWNWTDKTIEYAIGLKEGVIDGADRRVELPDDGWQCARGKTAQLSRIYEEIYRDGALRFEIETFTSDGNCEIFYQR